MPDGSTQYGAGKATRIRVAFRRQNKHNTRYPVYRLPFVGRANVGHTMWDMPATDGDGTGCDMGYAAASAFLKALRASTVDTGGYLQRIVLDLMQSGFDVERDHGRKVQVVGFFAHLDSWLVYAAKSAGPNLDATSEKDIEAAMTRAANESDAEREARYNAALREKYGDTIDE